MGSDLEDDGVEVEFGAFVENGDHFGLHLFDGESGF